MSNSEIIRKSIDAGEKHSLIDTLTEQTLKNYKRSVVSTKLAA